MGSSLGSFGTAREVADFDFDYFGTKVRVDPGFCEDTMLDLAQKGIELSEADESTFTPERIREMRAVIAGSVVHPDDLEDFLRVAKANRQSTEDISNLVQQVVEAVTERPTTRQSSSSAGQPRTKRKSAAGSSLRVQHDLESKDRPGGPRPDLAMFPLLARQEREARSA